jgi:hypothetical protein
VKKTSAIEFQNEFAGFPEKLTADGRYFPENLQSVKQPKYENILQTYCWYVRKMEMGK